MRVLVIDNLDLFTYNLVDELEKKECEVLVYGNNTDMKTIDNVIKAFKPKLIVISSGAADEPGISIDVVRAYQGQIPIFGVGSGMHFIIEAFEGKVSRSASLRILAKISHDGKTIFKKLENNFEAGVYNTLSATDIPYSFEVSARNENDTVMGIRHKEAFVEGIQFDPSSLLTVSGSEIIENLLKEIGKK